MENSFIKVALFIDGKEKPSKGYLICEDGKIYLGAHNQFIDNCSEVDKPRVRKGMKGFTILKSSAPDSVTLETWVCYNSYYEINGKGVSISSSFDDVCEAFNGGSSSEQATPTQVTTPAQPTITQPQQTTPANGVNDALANMMNALNVLQSSLSQPQQSGLSSDDVKALITKAIEDDRKKTYCHTIQINEHPEIKLKKGERVHSCFRKVFDRMSKGFAIYLVGPAGTGKTTLAEQLAKAFNQQFVYINSLCQKYEVEGYTNAAGAFVETDFFDAFVNGKFLLIDEADNSFAEAFKAINTAISQRYYHFPSKGVQKAHPNFKCIVAGNTCGRGSVDGFNGAVIDVSTLDRFRLQPVGYDREIEIEDANGNEVLVDFFHELRDILKEQNLQTYQVSPRAIKRIVASELADDEPLWETLHCDLCGYWSKSDIILISNYLKGTSKYHKAFKEIANNI